MYTGEDPFVQCHAKSLRSLGIWLDRYSYIIRHGPFDIHGGAWTFGPVEKKNSDKMGARFFSLALRAGLLLFFFVVESNFLTCMIYTCRPSRQLYT